MSESLDRRIAIEIFGEEEPSPSTTHFKAGVAVHTLVFAENWLKREIWDESGDWVGYRWRPAPFSSVLEEALRAFDKWVLEVVEDVGGAAHPVLYIEYHPGSPGLYMARVFHLERWDEKLEVAICNLLLALKDKK